MVIIVKRYPPKGNLQLFRYDSNTPFECWRCQETKVSKLQAVVTLKKPHIICNACYGYLLSLAEIKAQDIEPWQKADQIHDLTITQVSERVAASAVEKQEQKHKQYWKFTSREAKRFIGTAEFLYERMLDHDDLDFSGPIIELIKAFEHECVSRFVEPMRAVASRTNLLECEIQKDCQDDDFGHMAKYVFGHGAKPPELGRISHALDVFIHSKKRIQDSRFLKILDDQISLCHDRDYFINKERFVAQVNQLTQSYRNPAAHIGSMSKKDYEECEAMLMNDNGALWQLITAIR
ncbi:MAG: hypothetical protein WCE94_15615 [Candidatus Methanoperedens sp.]